MSNTFGRLFRITTFGESHGSAVGVVIDGCPPRVEVAREVVQRYLNQRRPGQSALTSPRQEKDRVEILSGIEDNLTLGTPIALLVRNTDVRREDYRASVLRPSHADFTYLAKYGIKAQSGGGRASARETVGRVAAGAVAMQVLQKFTPELEILTWVDSVKDICCDFSPQQMQQLTAVQIEGNPLRCPDPERADAMRVAIEQARDAGDSVGGCITTMIKNCPVGLGEPVFAKLDAQLAQAMLSLPAVKGFELGSGFHGTLLHGSEHNDAFVNQDGQVRTTSNHSGGVQGGISNGADIYFRTAFKPVSTIFKPQQTLDTDQQPITYQPQQGRHDPCVLPRAVPIVTAMTALVLADNLLLSRSYCGKN